MKPEDIQFLDKLPNAQRLYFEAAVRDERLAAEMVRFLREAHMRHFPVVLSVQVQGVNCSVNLSFDNDGPGWELYNFLSPWCISMQWRSMAIKQQMLEIWPHLANPDLLPPGIGGPQIIPERP